MTLGGWFVMLLSIGSVLSLLSYCLYMTLTLPSVDQIRLDENNQPINDIDAAAEDSTDRPRES